MNRWSTKTNAKKKKNKSKKGNGNWKCDELDAEKIEPWFSKGVAGAVWRNCWVPSLPKNPSWLNNSVWDYNSCLILNYSFMVVVPKYLHKVWGADINPRGCYFLCHFHILLIINSFLREFEFSVFIHWPLPHVHDLLIL